VNVEPRHVNVGVLVVETGEVVFGVVARVWQKLRLVILDTCATKRGFRRVDRRVELCQIVLLVGHLAGRDDLVFVGGRLDVVAPEEALRRRREL
jgi:hypothetical protein